MLLISLLLLLLLLLLLVEVLCSEVNMQSYSPSGDYHSKAGVKSYL